MDESSLVVTNKFIDACFRVEVNEMRVLQTLAYKVKGEHRKEVSYEERDDEGLIKDPGNLTYRITKKEIEEITDFCEKRYDRMVSIVAGLENVSVEFKDRKSDKYRKISLGSDFKYNKGTFEIELSRGFKSILIDLSEGFTKHLLEYMRPLSSIYSIRMYQLLKRYEFMGKKKFELSELFKIMGVDTKKSYKRIIPGKDGEKDEVVLNYSPFKQKILKKSQEELTAFTDITFTYKEHKEWRKVTALTFSILPNAKKAALPENIADNKQPKLAGLDQAQVSNLDVLQNELQLKYGYTGTTQDLMSSYNLSPDAIIEYWNEILKPVANSILSTGKEVGGLIRTRYKNECLSWYELKQAKRHKEEQEENSQKAEREARENLERDSYMKFMASSLEVRNLQIEIFKLNTKDDPMAMELINSNKIDLLNPTLESYSMYILPYM